MEQCVVCAEALDRPLYATTSGRSLTSTCAVRRGDTRVFQCRHCTHLQSAPLPDLDGYYADEYRLLDADADEDQIIAIRDGAPVYRSAAQAQAVLAAVELRAGARVLDWGCAKAATLRHLAAERGDLVLHCFDVTSAYERFWREFVAPEHTAVGATPADWSGRFDLVTAFFVLEHVPNPVAVLRRLRELLRPDGVLYLVVPNVSRNPADLVVADHVNHFRPPSLRLAMSCAALAVRTIDADGHAGALVATATRAARPEPTVPIPALRRRLLGEGEALAAYFARVRSAVRAFEEDRPARPAAIYGAGFYGSLILADLGAPERVVAFVDRNPHLQGRTHHDRPVVAPERLPDEVEVVYVGLNPAVADAAVAEIDAWRGRGLDCCFLPPLAPAAAGTGASGP